MGRDLRSRIALIAADRESGASEILAEALAIFRDAFAERADILPIARAICRAQPSMAPIWNAAIAALSPGQDLERFARFAHRASRAPEALVRFAVACFEPGARAPLRITTISFSRSVALVLDALARTRTLRVACSESRPALEGRRLASRLAATGVPVSLFSDNSIAHALGATDAVIVGADAVSPEWVLNKSGTRMLAAAAAQQGVPVFVLATRDKFVSHGVAARLVPREGGPSEIWDGAPRGVMVRNPYFESTPLELVTSIVTDIGVLGVGMVPDLCAADAKDEPPELLESV